MNLIELQIEEGFHCFDVKPENFVYNKGPNNSVDVKMIDFGIHFCKESKVYTNYANNELIPFISGMTFKEFFYVSNAIQMYLISENQMFFGDYFNHPLCIRFFSGEWEQMIRFYIETAIINQRNGSFDPSNNLVHYACILFDIDKNLMYVDNDVANYIIDAIIDKLSV